MLAVLERFTETQTCEKTCSRRPISSSSAPRSSRCRFDFVNQKKKLTELEAKTAADNFWQVAETAQAVMAEVKKYRAVVIPFEKLEKRIDDVQAMLDLAQEAGDEATFLDAERDLKVLEQDYQKLEIQSLFNEPGDDSNCFLTVQAGAGGNDACDWTAQLFEIYVRYAKRHDFEVEIVDQQEAEVIGIRSATMLIKGPYASGYLRGEVGVHRLVRVSPFDTQSRRQTSFASVDVVPEAFHSDVGDIEIKDSEIELSFTRSGGKGGQNVNKVESAVRIVHIPSGLVVRCSSERSQHQNRAIGMELLKSKIYQMERAKKDSVLAKLYGAKGEVSFGYQIRNYVMNPYTIVKDARTEHETGDIQRVIAGEIDDFIEAYLKWFQLQKSAAAAKAG